MLPVEDRPDKPSLEQLQADLYEQRARAMDRAHHYRRMQGQLRKMMKDGTVDPLKALRGDAHPMVEDVVSRLRLSKILSYVPGVGAVTSHQIIEAFQAAPDIKMRDLSPERRDELATMVKGVVNRLPA